MNKLDDNNWNLLDGKSLHYLVLNNWNKLNIYNLNYLIVNGNKLIILN